ncbi:MAG: type II toxin-antitoxin system Phd/YefM family antitoxin [Desulfobulbaceae bacterium]|jgi:prevent-host-death family protein|nr:type II toxin-antitoxin system Phd/YefM family antitoxin [Desulfobulbaceae bacterium]
MRSQWALQDAKNKFSEVVSAACGGTPQVVTKRGVPAVVVLSFQAYEGLARRERMDDSFASFLLSMPTDGDEDAVTLPALKLREVEW